MNREALINMLLRMFKDINENIYTIIINEF